MGKLSMQQVVFAGFALAATLVLALAAITWNLTQQTLRASEFVAHTLRVIGSLNAAETSLYRSDAGRRAYLLDAKPLFLRDRDIAFGEMRLRVDEAAALTLDNPTQQSRLKTLREALAELDASYRRPPNGAEADVSEPLLQRVRPMFAALLTEERRLLADRQQDEADSVHQATLTFGAFVLLLIVLLPVLFWRIRADLLARQQAEATAAVERRYDTAHARALTLYNAKSDRSDTLAATLALLAEDPLFPVSAFYALEPLGGILQLTASRATPADIKPVLHLDDGAIGMAARSGSAMYLDRFDKSAPGLHIETGLARIEPAALLICPVLHQGVVLGVLVLACSARLGQREREFVDRLAAQLGVALHNLQQVEDLSLLAEQLRASSEDIRRKNDELERASRMKSEFVANMSHELRTPLNAVMGFAEILRDGLAGELTAEQKEHVGDIYTSGRHLLSLINDILDLSKVEAGQMQLELAPVAPAELVASGASVVREKAALRRIQLTELCPPDLGRVNIDLRRAKQIVYNLLSNAVKFTPDGGAVSLGLRRVSQAQIDAVREAEDVRLFAPLGAAEQWLEIAVTDSGIGIAPDALRQLFQPFMQIDSSLSRRFEGTGLGLTMVQRLTELHGGGLMVRSTPGQGSTFTVWLPWRTPEQSTQTVSNGTEPAQAPVMQLPVVKAAAPDAALILLIEDDPRAASLVRVQLEAQGYRIEVASSAERGLLRARELQPQAIVLDVILPGMDGWNMLAQLKEHEATQRIPVVIVSITDEPRRGFALGAAQVLVKPVSHDDLLAALAAMGLRPHAQGGEVLVVDDDPKAVALVSKLLQSAGFTPRAAYGGRQAIELVRERRPDLIVLDLMMPHVTGFDVLEALASREDTCDIPVLVLTAKLITAQDRDQLRGRVQRVMEKAEFAPASLLAEVRRALARRAG